MDAKRALDLGIWAINTILNPDGSSQEQFDTLDKEGGDAVTALVALQKPTQEHEQILPGQDLDGGTVIASVILNDTDYEDTVVIALVLMPTPGEHYRLVEVWEAKRQVITSHTYVNIVPAVEAFVENGGDY